MRVSETDLPSVLLVDPDVHGDHRGFFLETWQRDRYAAHGIIADFVQDNHSRSRKDSLRGLHAQIGEHPQGKLVRAVRGTVFDVAVDIRLGSPSFGRWTAAELSEENFRQIWIPPGFAHGFCVLTDAAEVEYKCTASYHRDSELTVLWSDPALAIPWPVGAPLLSEKDRQAPTLDQLTDRLPRFG